MLALLQLTGQAPTAAVVPRIIPDVSCVETVEGDEIIVCGRRKRSESYRLPEQFREAAPDDREVSPLARTRDENVVSRYSNQSVGPFGYLEQSRRIDCEWRAERQAIRGERLDCTRDNRPLDSR